MPLRLCSLSVAGRLAVAGNRGPVPALGWDRIDLVMEQQQVIFPVFPLAKENGTGIYFDRSVCSRYRHTAHRRGRRVQSCQELF